MLPKEFPKWESVYYYYRELASLEEFDLLLEHLRGSVRLARNQSMEPSVGIITKVPSGGIIVHRTALTGIRKLKE